MDPVYIDTAIWRDFFEDRKDAQKDLGKIAEDFLMALLEHATPIILSGIVMRELRQVYSAEELHSLLARFQPQVIAIEPSTDQFYEAHDISLRKNVPFGDALHAVMARDHQAILITRDKDFRRLCDVCPVQKPEDAALPP